MIPLINVGWSIHSVLDPFIYVPAFFFGTCGCDLLLHLLTNSSTLFLHVCINSSSSASMISSFSWLGFMCIRLLPLPFSLPGFVILNGSLLSEFLMGITAFLFNAMADTSSSASTVNWFDFLQGCLCYWSFMSFGWSFWLAATAFIFFFYVLTAVIGWQFFLPFFSHLLFVKSVHNSL